MRFLRRFGLLGSSPQIKNNIKKLLQRQEQQLSLLEPLKNNVDKSLLNTKVEDLVKINNQTVFNTFATRCLSPQVRNLNGLADVNIERVFQKQGHNKIPFTVKDHLKVDGMIQTCGFADNLTPSKVSSDVVQLLEKEGCIAFAHSNVPQGLLGIKSQNPVYGRALNPYNPKFVAGGSSGGQGSLVASKACAFGLGSDSGGSARIPAAFSGTYGFKPTGSKRLSVRGRVGPSGVEGIKIGDVDPSFGFLTRNLDDIVWLCSKTIGKNITPYDPLMYGQWDQTKYQAAKRKKLKIGYIYTNHEMKVAPGIVNSINETIEALRADKHTVVEFNFPKLHLFRNFFFQYVYLSGFLNGMIQRMEGHPPNMQASQFCDLHLFGKLGVWLKSLRSDCDVQKQMKSMYRKVPSRKEFFKIHKQVDEIRKLFYQQWHQKGIDVLLSPVMPFTAPLPGTTDLLVYQLTYCCFQNILQLPSGSIPTRLVKQQQTKYSPVTSFEKKAAQSIWQSKGLPLAIQVTGRHLADQECLGAMWQINKLVGNFIDPSFLTSK